MNWQDFAVAHDDAKRTIVKANSIRKWAAEILADHLKSSGIDVYILAALKREMKNFDLRSLSWK